MDQKNTSRQIAGCLFSQGFTLIELVLVIVIIGILAALAIPRFKDLQQQALIAQNQSFAGTIRSTFGILHAAWIAAGAPAYWNTVTIENNQGVGLNDHGWPSDGGGTANLTLLANRCASAINGTYFITNAPVVAAFGGCATSVNICYFAPANAVNGVCNFHLYHYGVDTNYGITYNYVTGEVDAY